jgi:dTDP-4-dehydrorhamnose reductase
MKNSKAMHPYTSIVITGSNGMLGHALTDALHARDVKPILLPRAHCDLASEEDVRKIFDHRPTLLLNCAAHTKVDLCEQEPDLANRVNGTAVGQMAKLCKEHGTTLVHVSTDFVFNGRGTEPYKVDEPVAPLSAYGKSKLLGETELQKNAPPNWLIVRTAWVYGRHGANFPKTMVTVAKAGKPLAVVSDQVGAPTYTVDLAAGILALLDQKATGIFHITNSGQTNWCDFARAALAEFGVDHPVTAITSADWERQKPTAAARPRYSVLDLSRFSQVTGITPRSWQEALAAFRHEVDAAGGF